MAVIKTHKSKLMNNKKLKIRFAQKRSLASPTSSSYSLMRPMSTFF